MARPYFHTKLLGFLQQLQSSELSWEPRYNEKRGINRLQDVSKLWGSLIKYSAFYSANFLAG